MLSKLFISLEFSFNFKHSFRNYFTLSLQPTKKRFKKVLSINFYLIFFKRHNPRQSKLEVGEHICAELGPRSVLGVAENGLNSGLSELKVSVGKGGLVRTSEGGVSKITIQILKNTFYYIHKRINLNKNLNMLE